MLKLKPAIFVLCLFPLALPAQMAEQGDLYEQKYEWRIGQENLYGVYIPKDVNEALLELNRLIDEPSKKKFLALPEEVAAHKLFFSLGRWMSYNWSFYDGSRLSVFLQKMGVHNPDDMSRFLIILYHRSLKKQPLEVKSLVEQIAKAEDLRKKERLQKGTIIYEEKRKVAPPENEEN
jgi:uncharacterized protein DUF6794